MLSEAWSRLVKLVVAGRRASHPRSFRLTTTTMPYITSTNVFLPGKDASRATVEFDSNSGKITAVRAEGPSEKELASGDVLDLEDLFLLPGLVE